MTNDQHSFLTVCERAARAGGAVLQRHVGRFAVREKGPKDLVTDADLASQRAIRSILSAAFPTHQFVGEEADLDEPMPRSEQEPVDFRWIVDPLDGTLNYIRRMPSYCVSVALEQAGALQVATVYDPLLDECFTAARGQGAFLNGQPVRASRCVSLDEALVAVSFSTNVPRTSIEIRRFTEVLCAGQSVRRTGSAALNLCYVGSGRLDAYFASSVHVWDVAAGVLIAREAGAVVTSIAGGAFDLRRPNLLTAATRGLHAELLGALKQAE